jgi:protein TonB
MAPLTKDALEVANSAIESRVPHATTLPKPATGHMRSDALSLEVAVRVHGSKVKDVVLGTTPHTEPFEEQTSTMIIFPQGGVLRMNTAVNVGQMLVLTNLKSRQDAICRVIKVRPNANLAAYIEVEFTQRQPGYWGVNFPSDIDAATNKVAPQAPAVSPGPELNEKTKPASDVSWPPAPAPPSAAPSKPLDSDSGPKESKPTYDPPPPPAQRFVPAAKPEPSFISIGSQEEVQPAASSTAQMGHKQETFDPAHPKSPVPVDLASAPPAAPPLTLSMSELRGDGDAAPSIAAHASDASAAEEQGPALAAAPTSESSRSTFGSFAGGNTLTAVRSASPDDFGARLDAGFGASEAQNPQPRVNWMMIAAGAAVLITVLGGGLYFRTRSANSRAASANPARSQPPTQTAPAPAPAYSVQSPPVTAATQLTNVPPNPAAPLNATNPATTAAIPSPASAGKPVASAPPQPVAMAKPVAPKVTPDMMSQSLNSHPTPAQRTDAGGADAAPVLAASADSDGNSAALSGISSSPRVPALPPPTIQPEGPIKIGGDVKAPRLISSALPVYPLAARQTGVEGDVSVTTTIDKDGNVVGMHVISGPTILRQAALDALRRWKYEPSRLNGQPIAVEMQVTIKFRR